MPPKAKEKDLLPADDAPRWIVTSTDPDSLGRQTHRLRYGKSFQAGGKTPGDLRRFRELADFCNKRGLAPRPKILCRADENLPVPKHKQPGAEAEASAETTP